MYAVVKSPNWDYILCRSAEWKACHKLKGYYIDMNEVKRKGIVFNLSSVCKYDDNGNIQYEDDLDLSGNQVYEYKFDTRFLDASSNILIDEEDYLTRLNNGENVYIACFVGCTYHCG